MSATANPTQLRLTRTSPTYWRVTIDNPPINTMNPPMGLHFQEIIGAIELDKELQVVVFDSAVDG